MWSERWPIGAAASPETIAFLRTLSVWLFRPRTVRFDGCDERRTLFVRETVRFDGCDGRRTATALNRPLTAAGQVKESARRLGQGTGPNHFGGNVVQLAVALLTGTDQHLERSF